MRPLVGQQAAQPGCLDMVVAGHPAPQRALAVHHLVVADRQHEVLAERVQHREGHLVVVVAAVDRIATDVVQGVVHPAHVPLHREAKAAKVCRAGDARPGGGLLGDGDDAGRQFVDGGVHLLQELHGLKVLPAAVGVGAPAARGPGVVQVQHRGNRVDAQTIDVELLQPEQRVGHQEVADLGSAEVENVCAPVQLLTAARVGVFVEGGPVEAAQCPGVLGEVRGDPVHDHPDAGPVQGVDQEAKVVRGAEPRGRRVVRGDLIPPRTAERVLGHRQQLHVGEAMCDNVIGQLLGEFAVAQAGPPRSQVHLVGAHRLENRIAGRPPRHPLVVVPGVAR